MTLLEQFIQLQVLAFILTFVRIGTAAMIMPGIGDSFVPANVRLYFALAFSLVLMPFVAAKLPQPMPVGAMFFVLIFVEFLVGALIGTVARTFMSITDTAGMIVSFQSGLSNAQLFNPQMAGQGSLIGAFFSITGATLLFTLDLHHLLIAGMIESYNRFPLGDVPDVGSVANLITRSVAAAFMIACQMAAPFLVVILLLYAAMGVLTRLMPQMQIFILMLPVQILLGLLVLMMVFSASMMLFVEKYRDYLGTFLGG